METATGIRRFTINDNSNVFISSLSDDSDEEECGTINIDSLDIDNICEGKWCTFQLPNNSYVICTEDILGYLSDIDAYDSIKEMSNTIVVSSKEEAENLARRVTGIKTKGYISDKILKSYTTIHVREDTKTDDIVFSYNSANSENYYNNETKKKLLDIICQDCFRQRITESDNSYVYNIEWDGNTSIYALIGASGSICGIFFKEEEHRQDEDSFGKLIFSMLNYNNKSEDKENENGNQL